MARQPDVTGRKKPNPLLRGKRESSKEVFKA